MRCWPLCILSCLILTGCSKEPATPRYDTVGSGLLLPKENHMGPPCPNPFSDSTTVHYELGSTDYVLLAVLNPIGDTIVTLINEQKSTGRYTKSWYGRNANNNNCINGFYHLYFKAGDYSISYVVKLER